MPVFKFIQKVAEGQVSDGLEMNYNFFFFFHGLPDEYVPSLSTYPTGPLPVRTMKKLTKTSA